MNRRILMGASALVMGALGICGSFLPQELLALTGAAPAPTLTAAIQLLGALYLAFAMLNWMAKDSLLGGIYNRPVAVGNLMHFAVGAITLAKLVIAGDTRPAIVAAVLVYAAFAAGFASVVFGSPVKSKETLE